MATYYWVGGSGSWNSFDSSRWSLTSGGAGGAGVPTVDDTVIFNSASSGVSYVVQCDGSGQCGQITTSIPATGTLTFSNTVSGSSVLFTATSFTIAQTVNIHAGCLFNTTGGGSSYAVIYINNSAGTATVVTFNGSGTNTQGVGIELTGSGNVTFCNAQTCTFANVQISTNAGFTCSSSNITINMGVADNSGGRFSVSGATNINMAATNLVVGSLTTRALSTQVNIDSSFSPTPVWSIAGLNITMRAGQFNNYIFIGSSAPTPHPTIGAVTLEGVTTGYTDMSLHIARCTTLTVRDVTVIVGPSTYSDPIFNASGAVAVSTTAGSQAATRFQMSEGAFTTVTFSSTFTVTGLATNYAEARVAGNSTLASLSVTDGTFRPTGATIISGATTLTRGDIITTLGQGYTLTTGDITGTGQTATAGLVNTVEVDTLVCPSLTLTNTRFYAYTNATINGGVGKTFSFTVNASAPVNGDYPDIRVAALTVSTPTMSIVGTATKRVVFSFGGATSTAVVNITPTPTLQYVSFFNTQINNGVSNYTGTALGTDGLSTGFVPQALRSVYCVAAGTQNFDAAIWATTPGGAGSTANYPLPQDTIIFTTAVVGVGSIALLSPSTKLYVGSITVEASTNTVSIAEDSNSGVTIFGSLYTAATFRTYIGRYISGNGTSVVMQPSGTTTRYVSGFWSIGEGFGGSFTFGGNNNTTYNLSGTLTTQLFGTGFYNLSGLTIDTNGLTTLSCVTLNLSIGTINFASTAISATTATFTNSAPSLDIADTPYTLTLNGTLSSGSPATYTNNGSHYRGGLVVLRDSTSGGTYYFRLQSLNVRRLTLFSNGAGGTARSVTLFNSSAVVQDFTTAGATVSWTIAGTGGVRTITKQGGGRVQLTGNLTANAASASPANTWYVSGTLSQTGGSTGWVQGTAPRNSGGFFAL